MARVPPPAIASTALAVMLAFLPASLARAESPGLYREPLALADGSLATLYHFVPEEGLGPRPTLLLLPDVGMTWRSFDFQGHGLAPFLAWHGVEVFVVDYRGAGRSQVPAEGVSFEALLEGEAEAAFARAGGDRARIFVGGCGLGGSLALMLAGRHPDRVAGVVGLQAAVTFDFPNEPLARLAPLAARAPGWLDLRKALGGELFAGRSWFEVLLANDGSIREQAYPRLRRAALAPLSRRLLVDLAGFMAAGRIEVRGHDLRDVLAGWRGRSLLFVASRDNWIHPEFCVPTDPLAPESTEVRVLNPLEGARHEYGHLGMLLGEGAARDVWGPALAFLKRELP